MTPVYMSGRVGRLSWSVYSVSRVGDPDYILQCFQDTDSQDTAYCDYHGMGGACATIPTQYTGEYLLY